MVVKLVMDLEKWGVMVMNMVRIMMFIFVEVYIGFDIVVIFWDCFEK